MSDSETVESKSGEAPDNDKAAKGRKRLPLGLDLGTLESCILSKLSKPGSEKHHGIFVPTVVGYPEEGILAGILPGNSTMLHGNDALSNQLHLRLVHPLSDGVIQDLEASRSFLGYLRDQVDPERASEALCVIGIPAVADEEAKNNLEAAAKSAFDVKNASKIVYTRYDKYKNRCIIQIVPRFCAPSGGISHHHHRHHHRVFSF